MHLRWYEASAPWMVGNNQGVESHNRVIKDEHTMREQLNMGAFVGATEKLTRESSERDDTVLFSSR